MAGPVPLRLLPDTAAIDDRGHLSVGGCDLVDLARTHGTPLFVFDEAHLRARCAEALAAFGPGVAYAAKAFLCVEMARLVAAEGLALDVASHGELHTALVAGVDASQLVLHGNNKSDELLAAAIDAGVGRIVVDSFDELDRLETLLDRDQSLATDSPIDVMLRVTPGVSAETHEYVQTGQNDSKFGFGVASGDAHAAMSRALNAPGLNVRGIHSHIGSQVFRVESYAQALEVIAGFAADYDVDELSIGGGLGVAYVEDEHAPTITEWGSTLRSAAEQLGLRCRLTAEPGRAIAAAAAVTLYSVGTIKRLSGIRTYVAVDGGYGDNPRPMMYGSDYTTFVPARADAERPDVVRLVGSHCESGDVIVRNAPVPADLAIGDIIATPVTGAYGYGMGSNYNRMPRGAVVFVSDGQARTVIRRETLDDLLRLDTA